MSRQYYGHEISEDQKRVANRVRNLVASQIGTYNEIKSALFAEAGYSEQMKARARSMATRQLSLQWVVGDAEKAESSFFKINTQGTPLDKTEELVLRNRKTPVAIAARSIFRAGTGHQYWSQFEEETSDQIVKSAKKIHSLLFKPELQQPIKTLALPLGGGVAPLNALDLLIRFVALANGSSERPFPTISQFPDDSDGNSTIDVLKKSYRAASWMTGDEPNSLGLHPAVYFYTDQVRHSTDMFLAFLSVIARKVHANQKHFSKNSRKIVRPLKSFLLI